MMRTLTLFGPSKQPRKNHPGAKRMAYIEGQRAFIDGTIAAACPYTDTELRTEWERGWKIAAQRRAELR